MIHNRGRIFPTFTIRRYSYKLIFEWSDRKLSLLSCRRVKMAPPTSEAIADYRHEVGFWVTVSDRNGHVLYRRTMSNPMKDELEDFGDSPEAPIRRVAGRRTKVTFMVVVPDLPAGTTVELVSHDPPSAEQAVPDQMIRSFSLSERPQKGNRHGNQ